MTADELEVRWRRTVARTSGVGSGSGMMGLYGVRQAERLFDHLVARDLADPGDRLEIEAGPPRTTTLAI